MAFGTVYEAHDRDLDQRVALKLLRARGGRALSDFKREFRTLAELRYEHLVSLYELFAEDGTWYFTMELLVEARDFVSWVRDDPVVAPPTETRERVYRPASRDDERTVTVVAPTDAASRATSTRPTAPRPYDVAPGRLEEALVQLAHGLTTLHRAGKLHRDLKPSNVLVDAADRVVLVDFGLVRDARSDEPSDLLLSLDAGEPHRVGLALGFEALNDAMVGNTRERQLRDNLRRAAELGERLDDAHVRGLVQFGRAAHASMNGDFGASLEDFDAAEATFTDRCTDVALELFNCRYLRATLRRGGRACGARSSRRCSPSASRRSTSTRAPRSARQPRRRAARAGVS